MSVEVLRWDGLLQEGGPSEVDPTEDNAWLSDGRVLSGRLESISNGNLTVQVTNEKEPERTPNASASPAAHPGQEREVIPVARLRTLQFAQPANHPAGNGAVILRPTAGQGAITYQWEPLQGKSKPALLNYGNTRASFAQGGVVTFELESWSPSEVLVKSPVFGSAKFDPAAFTRLQFLEPPDSNSKPAPAGVE